MSECIFCRNLPRVTENHLAYAIYDINPVSKGHTLVIPKRHVEHIFDTTADEFLAIRDLLLEMKNIIQVMHSPDGFNIWSNSGSAAGQVVMHAHLHLIPRYCGQAIQVKDHLKGNIE